VDLHEVRRVLLLLSWEMVRDPQLCLHLMGKYLFFSFCVFFGLRFIIFLICGGRILC
jgi:hypothetical protein